MGGGASVLQEIRQDWLDIFKAMKLKNYEVKRLYKIYNSVDADRSGSIDVVELLTFLDIERTPFTERIFEAFDKDHTRRVDFYEFVVSAWKFCVLGNEAACVFAFDLYDTNADGKLTCKEVTDMFREILGSKALEQENTSRVMHDLLGKAENGYLHEDTWRRFTQVHQALLLNVFSVQHKLRVSTLGMRHWTRVSKRRITIRPGCTVRLSDLMILHSHRKMFMAIKENDAPVGRVSSMMKIVLDNTDNAVHKKTPPPSPKNPQKNTRILMPTFAAFTSAAFRRAQAVAPSDAAVAAMRPHEAQYAPSSSSPGASAAYSPPRSPQTTSPREPTVRRKAGGHAHSHGLAQAQTQAHGGHDTAVHTSPRITHAHAPQPHSSLHHAKHGHVHHTSQTKTHPSKHSQDQHSSGNSHHHSPHRQGHGGSALPNLVLVHPSKDVLVG